MDHTDLEAQVAKHEAALRALEEALADVGRACGQADGTLPQATAAATARARALEDDAEVVRAEVASLRSAVVAGEHELDALSSEAAAAAQYVAVARQEVSQLQRAADARSVAYDLSAPSAADRRRRIEQRKKRETQQLAELHGAIESLAAREGRARRALAPPADSNQHQQHQQLDAATRTLQALRHEADVNEEVLMELRHQLRRLHEPRPASHDRHASTPVAGPDTDPAAPTARASVPRETLELLSQARQLGAAIRNAVC